MQLDWPDCKAKCWTLQYCFLKSIFWWIYCRNTTVSFIHPKTWAWPSWSKHSRVSVKPSYTELLLNMPSPSSSLDMLPSSSRQRSQTAFLPPKYGATASKRRRTVIETINFKLNYSSRGWHFTSEYHRRPAKLKAPQNDRTWERLRLRWGFFSSPPKKVWNFEPATVSNSESLLQKDWVLTRLGRSTQPKCMKSCFSLSHCWSLSFGQSGADGKRPR